MRWVESRNYVGPDRRRKAAFFRWVERRKKDCSSALPAAQVMLRQLHLRVLDLATAREAVVDFHTRLQVTATALQKEGQKEAAAQLEQARKGLAGAVAGGGIDSKSAEELQQRAVAALVAMR